ncbi:hypothetical protein MBORA_08780 [Methanobrevibacter oralis]|uniref:Uncharacterized protein n=1 Tax=Methanobrevibacter oralis TaxID=66851 RepID=A0A166CBX5_METOA|nr:hypothetical protein [Methanobrevibacter oralis]KZX12977.1 hypothetical protein MBORA_08780 [Methanobrevibacter oralis]
MELLIDFKIKRNTSNVGKPPFNLKDMDKTNFFYGYINKITSTVELSYNAKHNNLYNIISHGIEPSDRTIRDYCKVFSTNLPVNNEFYTNCS